MSEKYPNYQHNSGEQSPDEQTNAARSAESTVNREHLTWAVSEALLRAVYDAVEHPGNIRPATVTVAIEVVQAARAFDLTSEDDRRALAVQADYVADRLVELASAYDDLTTSDLQGAVGALALRLIRNELPIGGTEQPEGGDHE